MATYQVTFPGGKRVDCEMKGHVIHTDQPLKAGGDNSAPTPFDLFISSMATCAGIYALGFCQQRDLSTEGMHLTLETVKDEATGMISDIQIALHTGPDFPEKYKKAIVSAMDLCSVKKHLATPPQFDIVVKP